MLENAPVVKQSGGMMDVALSREVQSVQGQMILAQKFPRDANKALMRILEDCKRKSLAEKAVYSFPRGGQTVEGPSIRLVETIAKSWGNLDFGLIELENKPSMGNIPGESTMMAYCVDLETNTRSQKVFTVRHKRDTKKGSQILTDERDSYEIAANMGSRRLRSCILSVIPADIVEAALEQCDKTMAGGQGPLIDRVRSMVKAFSDFSVTQEMLEKRLGHKIDVTSETELVALKKIYTSLKDNFGKREDFFDVAASGPVTSEPMVDDAPPAEVKVQSVAKTKLQNHAPQTKEEAKAMADKVHHAEVVEPPPNAPYVMTRKEAAEVIGKLATQLKLNKETLAAKIKSLTKKDFKDLTDDEVIDLMGVMKIEVESLA